jgi:hypothetical protein
VLPTAIRARWATINAAFFGIGISLSCVIALYAPEWRMQIWFTVGFYVILVPIEWLFIQESVTWLISKGKLEEADKVTETLVKHSGKPQALIDSLKWDYTLDAADAKEAEVEADTLEKSYGLMDMFKYPSVRGRLGIMCLLWVAVTATYYGLTFLASQLPGEQCALFSFLLSYSLPFSVCTARTHDHTLTHARTHDHTLTHARTHDHAGSPYRNMVMLGLVEVPAMIAAPELLNRVGRRKGIAAQFFICLIFLIM